MHIKRKDGMNLTNSTVYRYMKLNGISSISRRKTHKYPRVEHHNIPNLLRRNFTTNKVNNKWSIDISYIFVNNGIKYLCAIKDMYDKSIIAYTMSRFIDHPLVLDTVKKAIKKVNKEDRKELILHSDQGWHFTNPVYIRLLKDNDITQSISYRGSSVDNVPIESFFSALKTECIYLRDDLTLDNVDNVVDRYIEYYNKGRLQENLKELAPNEFRQLAQCPLF